MSKLLLTADWHIADYPDYNYSEGFRINQFITLADRINELGQLYDCNSLVIAGDLVDEPTMSPTVLHVVKEVIDKLKSGFKNIYYILGQHDLATKSKNQSKNDTVISLFDSNNMIYMHHKVLNYKSSGCVIGFQNWTKNQDLSWLDNHYDKVDFLIGHYTKSKLFGQQIDESKFDWMIHGDIHNDQEIGKFISIGNPIQKDMSSIGNGSVIILDTDTKKFQRVRTDEDHTRFLRIDYTNDESMEGFASPLQYYIYKQKPSSKNSEELSSVEWNELDDLIDKIVTENNLIDIHNECSAKSNSYNDIDFNFQLLHLKIHGYRSVVDFELDFEENDRILFLGNNGSGKSSIMEGLNNLFVKNRSLMSDKSDFTEDMILELKLRYQNKIYEIKKGSEYGLKIDGVSIGYNKKADFDDDLFNKLPFLNYSDLFFINSNTSNFSNQFTEDRRIELITKFFRLGKLDALSNTAIELSESISDEITKDRLSIRDKESQLTYINNQIDQVPDEIKNLNESDLINKKNELAELRRKKENYETWKNKIEKLESKRKICTDVIETKKKVMTLDIDKITENYNKVVELLSKNSIEINELNIKWNKWINLHKKLNDLLTKGKDLRFKSEEMKKKLCPVCHQSLSDTPEHKHLIEKTTADLLLVRDEFKKTKEEYDELLGFKPKDTLVNERYYMDQSEQLLEEKNKLTVQKSDINTKILLYESAKKEHDKYVEQIKEIDKEIDELKLLKFDDIELPEDISNVEMSVQYQLNQVQQLNQLLKDKERLNDEISEINLLIKPKTEKVFRLGLYSKLTSRTGKIMELVLSKLSEMFSGDKIIYKVNSGNSRNKDWIKFESYYKVKNRYRAYNSLSDGQKNISDLDFLSKLFSSRVGLLVLDEYVKHLDESNSLLASEILGKLNVNTLCISTHSSNYPIFTKRVFLELTNDGKTKNTII